jgi:hypothetical protein
LVGDVKYNHKDQEELLGPVVGALVARLESQDLDLDAQQMRNLLWPSITAIARVAPLIKHKAFAEEREWRIYSTPMAPNPAKYDFLPRGNEIVPIMKFDLSREPVIRGEIKLHDICVRTTMVGPGANQADRGNALLMAMMKYEVHWRMGMHSSAPLR